MTGSAIVIDDASATDTIHSIKLRVFTFNRKLSVRRQQLVYRPGPRGIEPLADDETLGGAGVAHDGSAEHDVLLADLTVAEAAVLGPAFLETAENGRADALLDLLGEGANIELTNRHKHTALICAAVNGHADCVRLLMDAGADTRAKTKGGFSALVRAAHHGHADCVRLLLGGGAVVEDTDKHDRRTPLIQAADRGHTECVRLLIDCGAELETRDQYRCTALIVAVENRHTECATLLMDAGANKGGGRDLENCVGKASFGRLQ
jgi:hypothetical protein